MKIITLFVLLSVPVFAQDTNKPTIPVPGKRLWATSLVSLGAANALDIHSSWGKHELNPVLRGQNSNFGHEGALLKLALTGTIVGVEALVLRRNPNSKLYRALAKINFAASGVVAATAVRNYRIPRN